MKKLRVILSVFAIVLAVGATFAMRSNSSMTGYRHIPASPGVPEQCIEVAVECVVSAPYSCTLENGDEVKRFNNQTACGPLLKKPTP
jgi:hypothetical protein